MTFISAIASFLGIIISIKKCLDFLAERKKFTNEWISVDQHRLPKDLKEKWERDGYHLRFVIENKIEYCKGKGYEIIKEYIKKDKKMYMYNDGRGSILMRRKFNADKPYLTIK